MFPNLILTFSPIIFDCLPHHPVFLGQFINIYSPKMRHFTFDGFVFGLPAHFGLKCFKRIYFIY